MTEMNGYETIKALKEKWPAVKTIIYSMEFDGFNTKSMHGADAMVSKSSCPTKLKEAIERLSLQKQP
jgi:DNA-binding NarL/FixJ family response regulator